MKTSLKVLLWIVGVLAVIVIALQIVLSSSVLTKVVNNVADDYIDADVSFGEVKVSVLRNFPNLNVRLSDFNVTYPSDRFGEEEDNFYTRQGRGGDVDTLVSCRNFGLSINVAALAAGNVKIQRLMLDKPRVFAKSYADGRANWDIFGAADSTSVDGSSEAADSTSVGDGIDGAAAEVADSTSVGDGIDGVAAEVADSTAAGGGLPKIVLGRIVLRGHPHIVYSAPGDTVFAMIDLKRMRFNGRLSMNEPTKTGRQRRAGLRVDSLFVAGRLPSDTLALGLDKLDISAQDKHLNVEGAAKAFLATKSYGRICVPVDLKAEVSFPKDSIFTMDVRNFTASMAGIPLKANAYVQYGSRLYVRGDATIEKCKVNDVLDNFRNSILKNFGDIQTDAELSLNATFDGYYDSAAGLIPEITAHIEIPKSALSNKKFNMKNELALNTDLQGGGEKALNVILNEFHISGKALNIKASGSGSDLLGGDPVIYADAAAEINLDTLSRYVKKNTGMDLSGSLSATLKGTANLSHLDPYQLAQADIEGKVVSPGLKVVSKKDTLDLYTDNLSVWLGAVGNTRDQSVAQGERMLALVASVDSAYVSYKEMMQVFGKSLSLKAQNSAAILNKADSSKFYPFGGRLEIASLTLVGADTSLVSVSKSDNIFKISPKSSNPKIPVLTLTSDTDRIFVRGPINRISVTQLGINATAAMNTVERRQKAKAFVDSLSRAHPDVPRDSLFNYLRKQRASQPIPDWLTEKDFMKSDLNLRLSDSMARIFREWDAEGSLTMARANVMSPYFPLRNRVSNVKASFNNNEIKFDSFKLTSGKSDLSAVGQLTGLRGALLGRGILDLKMDISSDRMNVNELLGAWSIGSEFVPASSSSLNIDDDEYMAMVVNDTLANVSTAPTGLIIVPANLTADISLNAKNLTYSTLNADKITAHIVMKERTVQITDIEADTNVGDIQFEGFYATRTKTNLQTGFDLALRDITAEKVVELMPAVDTVMPLLKTFSGLLNCTLSATADLDTNMNFIMPSINGVLRIQGDDLTFTESEVFSQIAKTLKFKDRTSGHVDHMSVEGLIADNQAEIFPFVLKLDRYTLAMSGTQGLDSNFKYHVSVIESPLVFRLGIDLYGNFEDFKFKIGKAKYKSADVPVFSEVIDQSRLNLRESIHNIFQIGVERAIKQNQQQSFIKDFKNRIKYVPVEDMPLDSLSMAEKLKLRASQIAEAQDSLANLQPADTLGAADAGEGPENGD